MYQQLFRSAIFPTLDRLNGTRITPILEQLYETESYALHELLELQRSKLRGMLAYAGDNSPFYRGRWDDPAVRRAGSVYPELDGLPVVDKEDLRQVADDFPLAAYSGRVIAAPTGGSTGKPMTFLRSIEQESWFWALRIRMWRWAGYRLGEPYLAINLNPRLAWKKRLQDLLFRCTYLSYNADTQNSQEIVDLLRSRNVVHINGFSSCLVELTRYMRDRSISNPGVRTVTATGDNLSPAGRALIEDVLGVPVIEYYGAGGEGVHLASQCSAGSEYHVHVENAVVEILCRDRPAKPGETGAVVVTQLDNRAMPLIRYDLGDLATVSDAGHCACGRSHPLIANLSGRSADLVRLQGGGSLLPQFFFIGPFKKLERVDRYQIVQRSLDRITVRLVSRPGCDRPGNEQAIRTWVEQGSAGQLAVEFEWVDQIPVGASGKPKAVVSSLGD